MDLIGNSIASNSNDSGGPSNNSQPETATADDICQVCTDKSTGYHYGTPSCNGCKTFFRRTIMKKQSFVCQYNGDCAIDKSVRCACRHCRFKKCLAVGMNRDAIQQNRDPIGYTKRTRRYPPIKSAQTIPSSALGFVENSPTNSNSLVDDNSPETIAEDSMMKELMDVEKNLKIVRSSQIPIQKSLVDIVLQPSIFFDKEFLRKQMEAPSHNVEVLRRANQTDFHYWHERDWVIMIEWAKTISVYEKLPLSDKLALLRHSAITYPSLIQCFYTPDMGPDTIVFPNGAYFDRALEPDRPAGFQRKKFKMLDNLLNPIRKMNIDINEFAAAKAIFFLNPDADDLSAEVRNSIADTRSSLTNALYRYMVRRRGNDEAADRFGKLLLLGTVIATIAVEAKEAVVVADFFEQIQFSTFAKQLLFGLQSDEEVMDNSGSGTTTCPPLTNTTIMKNSSSTSSSPQVPTNIPDIKQQHSSHMLVMTNLGHGGTIQLGGMTPLEHTSPSTHAAEPKQQPVMHPYQHQLYMQQHFPPPMLHPHQISEDAREALKINGFSPP